MTTLRQFMHIRLPTSGMAWLGVWCWYNSVARYVSKTWIAIHLLCTNTELCRCPSFLSRSLCRCRLVFSCCHGRHLVPVGQAWERDHDLRRLQTVHDWNKPLLKQFLVNNCKISATKRTLWSASTSITKHVYGLT